MATFLLTLLLLIAAAAVLLAVSTWKRRARMENSGTLVGEAMRQHGITPADAADAGIENDYFSAVRECYRCAAEPECRAGFEQVLPKGIPTQCPNRGFFHHVVRHKVARRLHP